MVASHPPTYRHQLQAWSAELPGLTRHVGLPVIGHGDFLDESEQWQWYIVRLVILLSPLTTLVVAWLTSDEYKLEPIVVFGLPLYLAVVALIVVATVGSLWLSFQIGGVLLTTRDRNQAARLASGRLIATSRTVSTMG